MREPGLSVNLADAAATAAAGAALAATLPRERVLLGLSGELGAGKTTLTRGLLRGLGVTGPIRSPSYTLVEPYRVGARDVLHLDLYRLSGPDELAELGWRDLGGPDSIWIVEWPERGAGELGRPDLLIGLELSGPGRSLRLVAGSALGRAWLARAAGALAERGLVPDSI